LVKYAEMAPAAAPATRGIHAGRELVSAYSLKEEGDILINYAL